MREDRRFRPRRRLAAWGTGWAGAVYDLLCPPVCLLCGETERIDGQLCSACQGRLQRGAASVCPTCGVFHHRPPGWATPLALGLDETGAEGDDEPSVLLQGRRCRVRSPVGRFVTLGVYADTLRLAVIACKVPRGELLAETLGRRLGHAVRQSYAEAGVSLPDLVVPMPMFWLRRWFRGTHGVRTIAEAAAGVLDRPLAPRVLTMIRWTEKQGTLARTRRHRNVQDAFRVSRPAQIADRTVLLIDDVMTTGSTVAEATATLRAAGASRVDVATLARTADHDAPVVASHHEAG